MQAKICTFLKIGHLIDGISIGNWDTILCMGSQIYKYYIKSFATMGQKSLVPSPETGLVHFTAIGLYANFQN